MKKVLICLLLSGCALTPEMLAKTYGPRCEQMGFKSGSQEYGQCVNQMYYAEAQARSQAMQNLSQQMQNWGQPAQPRINCTTTQMGPNSRTTCY